MIKDYQSLRAAVAQWLARGDLADLIPTFIQMAEARINRDVFVRQRLVTVSGEPTDGGFGIPADFYRLQYLAGHHAALDYSMEGGTIHLPPGVDAYRMAYWAKIPALSDDAPTNWLLEQEPAIYLYAALIESGPVLKDDARIAMWSTLYENIVNQMQVNDDYARYGNGPAMAVAHAP